MPILVKNLKCDAEHCNHKEDIDTKVPLERYIGKSCPKCGESLLTQEDYETVQALQTMAETLDSLFPVVGRNEVSEILLPIELRGDGKLYPRRD